MPGTAAITNSQYVLVSATGKDRNGNSAPINTLTSVSSAPTVATVAQFGTDPTTFKVIGVAAGTAVITITAKNAAGTTLTNTVNVTVTAELAITLDLTVSAPINI